MTFVYGIYAVISHFGAQKFCRVVYVKIYLFHLKLRKNCPMLGEFKFDQHDFVHLFRKKLQITFST